MADDATAPDFFDEPEYFTVRGVVRGGQIVLAAPLDLPDDTVVTLEGTVEPPAADPPAPLVHGEMTEEQYRWFQEDAAWLRARAAARRAGPEAA